MKASTLLSSRVRDGFVALALVAAGTAGCAHEADDGTEAVASDALDVTDPAAGMDPESERALAPLLPSIPLSALVGKLLFFNAKFRGNGRTCGSCHSRSTGTIAPPEVEARFRANPRDGLFRSIDSDDGVGNAYTRLRQRATIRVHIPLPANVRLLDDPNAREVVLNRGVPTMFNTPKLDDVLMVDGRENNVEAQALGAVKAHAQPQLLPSRTQLELIGAFERELFTSPTLRRFADGGPAPELPAGNTELEKRGRRFFVMNPASTNPKDGMCAVCHGGPMLDKPQPFMNGRFQTVNVSEINTARNPVRKFVFKNADGTETTVASPDPGRALITGNAADANRFRVPTLWGILKTAPYFHDNSAANLEELMDQYKLDSDIVSAQFGIDLHITPTDRAEMIAYMKLIGR